MIRRAITIVGLAASLGVSLPAHAVPILDLESFENRKVAAADSLFTSANSTIGTRGSDEFINSSSEAIASSFLEPVGEPGAEPSFGSLNTTTLSGNTWGCGQPGWWFYCFELVALAPNVAVTTGEAAGEDDPSDQNVGDANGSAANRRLMRPLAAAMPMALILLTSGLAAVGIAGWQTLRKGRRARRRQRRRRLGLHR